MEEGQDTVENLVERFDLLKGEVDALQIAVLKQHAPWYKNVARHQKAQPSYHYSKFRAVPNVAIAAIQLCIMNQQRL